MHLSEFPHFHDSEIPWFFSDFSLTFNWFSRIFFVETQKQFTDNLNNVHRFWGFAWSLAYLKTSGNTCDVYQWFVITCFLGGFGAKRPSAGCPECISNRPRPRVSDWCCGAVILLSQGEFGREKNKICYQRGSVWTFCYMSLLWYNIVIIQHIFILRNNRCERSYFVFSLGSFARNRECETQVCVFGEFYGNIC